FLSRRNPTHLASPTVSFLHVLIVKEGNWNSNLGNLCDRLRWSSPPTENIVHAMGRDGRPAGAATGARSWISMDCTGRGIVLDVDKHEIMRRAQIHARDMRIIDPLLSYPSAILGREKAIVLNLEYIKAIITAEEILLRDPSEENVTPVVQELHRRLPPSVAHQAEGEGRGQHEAESAAEAVSPFEFRALEVALEAICSSLDARTTELEIDAYPALDELTAKVCMLITIAQ
ncbi:hypothetical protein BHM03_00033735, partial [Ensete ventricosum]